MSWKPGECFKEVGGNDHTLVVKTPLKTKSTVDLGLTRTAHSGYRWEFQSILYLHLMN